MKVPTTESEAQLEQLRREAELNGRVDRPGIRPPGSPFPQATSENGYYGLPLLKPPVWTWEIPTYFFVGGAGGAAAVIGMMARMSGADPKLVRDARWAAAVAANVSTPLLIADLGRPERFLNMLRIFKPQSPMSVGAWIVAAFGGTSTAAIIFPRRVADLFAFTSAALGLGMATYTGVLLGATAIPIWSLHVRLLPIHFGASALASAASTLELMGNDQRALNALALGAAAVETFIGIDIERKGVGPSGPLIRLGGVLSGPVPLALRLIGGRSSRIRRAAALISLAGSLITRFAWVEAGKASAKSYTAATDRVDDIRSGSENRKPIPPVSSDR
jgi:formate-dependent nitrite reductase membrane component NrfD